MEGTIAIIFLVLLAAVSAVKSWRAMAPSRRDKSTGVVLTVLAMALCTGLMLGFWLDLKGHKRMYQDEYRLWQALPARARWLQRGKDAGAGFLAVAAPGLGAAALRRAVRPERRA